MKDFSIFCTSGSTELLHVPPSPLPGCNSEQEAATQPIATWEHGPVNIPAWRPDLGVDLNKRNSGLSYPLWATQGSFMSFLSLANTGFLYEPLSFKTTFFQTQTSPSKNDSWRNQAFFVLPSLNKLSLSNFNLLDPQQYTRGKDQPMP